MSEFEKDLERKKAGASVDVMMNEFRSRRETQLAGMIKELERLIGIYGTAGGIVHWLDQRGQL